MEHVAHVVLEEFHVMEIVDRIETHVETSMAELSNHVNMVVVEELANLVNHHMETTAKVISNGLQTLAVELQIGMYKHVIMAVIVEMDNVILVILMHVPVVEITY